MVKYVLKLCILRKNEMKLPFLPDENKLKYYKTDVSCYTFSLIFNSQAKLVVPIGYDRRPGFKASSF